MNPYNNTLTTQVKDLIQGTAASREENDRLYPLVVAGNQAAIKQMIETNLPFVMDKVESFIRVYPGISHLRDDLVSEGFLGLCRAVNRMAEDDAKESPNATGYISYWIHKAIGMVVESEQVDGASNWTVRQRQKDGEKIAHRVEMEMAGGGEFYDFISQPDADMTADPMALPDLKDLIYSCCETEADRMIVDLRTQSYTYHEVAKALDLSYTATYMLCRGIYERFLAKSGMNGEV